MKILKPLFLHWYLSIFVELFLLDQQWKNNERKRCLDSPWLSVFRSNETNLFFLQLILSIQLKNKISTESCNDSYIYIQSNIMQFYGWFWIESIHFLIFDGSYDILYACFWSFFQPYTYRDSSCLSGSTSNKKINHKLAMIYVFLCRTRRDDVMDELY